jgi:paraquat-inducible protein B
MGKEALGLGETTPEGSEASGIAGAVPFLVRFKDTVGSLEAGAPVLVRGMRMGSVREVRVTFDDAANSFAAAVVIELDPSPFVSGEASGEPAGRVQAAIGKMVRNGLRAELAAANVLTGALAVALDMEPKAPSAELRLAQGGLPEIPTSSAPYKAPADQLEQVMTRVAALPLEQLVEDLNGLLRAARHVVEDPALTRLLISLAQTSEALAPAAQQVGPTLHAAKDAAAQARAALAEIETLVDNSQDLPDDVASMLDEAADGARAVRLLAELLERKPEALLRGRGN